MKLIEFGNRYCENGQEEDKNTEEQENEEQ